jgi:macrolide-specific efflux system membrane fusion protein
VTVAERALVSAEEGLQSAEARRSLVRAGARSEDRQAARSALARAEFASSEARAAFDASVANEKLDTADFDAAMARKRVELARVRYAGLKDELEMMRVRAPFDGVLTFVTGKRGDRFEAFAPIAIISDPRRLEVSVELPSADSARVSPGQETTVTTEAFSTREIRGKVLRTPGLDSSAQTGPNSAGNPRAVRLSFEPPGPGVTLGQLAQVTIITQQKDNIILIPNSAVRRFGPRRYVQVLGPDGRRRDLDIEIGLVTETDTEITKGLREGQRIIVQ